tara:strand:+ start:829 stop:1602 length:774 start_codon:yes stop_codon:yes gene_type:complete
MEYNRVLEYFTDQAKRGIWDTLYDTDNPLSHSFIHRYRKSIKLINYKNNKSILDMGCGTGILVSYALENNLKYFGMDNSKEMLDFIEESYTNEIKSKKVNLLLSDFQNFNDLNNFDIFFGIGFIEYFEDPFVQIKKILNFLNNDRQLILSFPNTNSLDNLMLKIFYYPKKIIRNIFSKKTHQPPRTMFTVKEILKFAEINNNFKIKIVNYNTNIFTYPFTRFIPRFSNFIGNYLEDSFLNKFSFFSSGFIVLFEKKY